MIPIIKIYTYPQNNAVFNGTMNVYCTHIYVNMKKSSVGKNKSMTGYL